MNSFFIQDLFKRIFIVVLIFLIANCDRNLLDTRHIVSVDNRYLKAEIRTPWNYDFHLSKPEKGEYFSTNTYYLYRDTLSQVLFKIFYYPPTERNVERNIIDDFWLHYGDGHDRRNPVILEKSYDFERDASNVDYIFQLQKDTLYLKKEVSFHKKEGTFTFSFSKNIKKANADYREIYKELQELKKIDIEIKEIKPSLKERMKTNEEDYLRSKKN